MHGVCVFIDVAFLCSVSISFFSSFACLEWILITSFSFLSPLFAFVSCIEWSVLLAHVPYTIHWSIYSAIYCCLCWSPLCFAAPFLLVCPPTHSHPLSITIPPVITPCLSTLFSSTPLSRASISVTLAECVSLHVWLVFVVVCVELGVALRACSCVVCVFLCRYNVCVWSFSPCSRFLGLLHTHNNNNKKNHIKTPP